MSEEFEWRGSTVRVVLCWGLVVAWTACMEMHVAGAAALQGSAVSALYHEPIPMPCMPVNIGGNGDMTFLPESTPYLVLVLF